MSLLLCACSKIETTHEIISNDISSESTDTFHNTSKSDEKVSVNSFDISHVEKTVAGSKEKDGDCTEEKGCDYEVDFNEKEQSSMIDCSDFLGGGTEDEHVHILNMTGYVGASPHKEGYQEYMCGCGYKYKEIIPEVDETEHKYYMDTAELVNEHYETICTPVGEKVSCTYLYRCTICGYEFEVSVVQE